MSLQESHFAEEDNGLLHYGVKGMKWGVRKDRSRVGSKEGSGIKKKTSSLTPEQKDKAKKAAKITASALILSGAAATSYILGKNSGLKRGDEEMSRFIRRSEGSVEKLLYSLAREKEITLTDASSYNHLFKSAHRRATLHEERGW